MSASDDFFVQALMNPNLQPSYHTHARTHEHTNTFISVGCRSGRLEYARVTNGFLAYIRISGGNYHCCCPSTPVGSPGGRPGKSPITATNASPAKYPPPAGILSHLSDSQHVINGRRERRKSSLRGRTRGVRPKPRRGKGVKDVLFQSIMYCCW